jgi:tetratricopeptide (TPR) repeat protein
VRSGQFAQAAEDYALLTQLEPADQWHWYYRGCLLAYLGDQTAHREHCRAMLELYGGSDISQITQRTAKTCLLLPDSAEPTQMLAMCERVLARPGKSKESESWCLLVKALALYRLGQFDGCLESTAKSLSTDRRDIALRTISVDLLRAMALQKLHRADEANGALAKALKRMEKDLPKAGMDDLGESNTENWLMVHVLCREAEGLVHQKAK